MYSYNSGKCPRSKVLCLKLLMPVFRAKLGFTYCLNTVMAP